MRSPFPGMDPYLEQRWGDFHTRAVTYAADALQPALPNDLRARVEERVFVEHAGSRARQFVPDVHVYQPPRVSTTGASTAVIEKPRDEIAEPFLLQSTVEITERYVEIIDVRSGGRVVTVIEVLSPANKLVGHGREQYLRKQADSVSAGVNLVEIDLLRIGQHTTLAPVALVPPEKLAPYHVSVSRANQPGWIEYYALPLRRRLPRMRIPLRSTDPDAILDLQSIIDQAYDRGRYDDIDYSQPLSPPLPPVDAEWAQQLMRDHQGNRA